MQFIETGDLGVRSAIYQMRRATGGVEFMLFPLLHVGRRSFYEEVSRRLERCDTILVEGISSRRISLLFRAYGMVDRSRRLDLVSQSRGLNFAELQAKLVHADLTRKEFDEHWDRLPIAERLFYALFAPLVLGYMLLVGPERVLARHLQVDDLPTRAEILMAGGPFAKSDELIVDRRDARLLQLVSELDQNQGGDARIVGVVYGAQHIRAVARLLLGGLGYHVVQAEWVTVIDTNFAA
jgi:hypothetical protein